MVAFEPICNNTCQSICKIVTRGKDKAYLQPHDFMSQLCRHDFSSHHWNIWCAIRPHEINKNWSTEKWLHHLINETKHRQSYSLVFTKWPKIMNTYNQCNVNRMTQLLTETINKKALKASPVRNTLSNVYVHASQHCGINWHEKWKREKPTCLCVNKDDTLSSHSKLNSDRAVPRHSPYILCLSVERRQYTFTRVHYRQDMSKYL